MNINFQEWFTVYITHFKNKTNNTYQRLLCTYQSTYQNTSQSKSTYQSTDQSTS